MKLSDQARRMIRVILSVNVAAAAVSLIYYRSQEAIPFILGLLVGGGTSLLRALLLERVVNKVISGDKPGSSVQVSHLGRLLIAFAALLVGAMVEGIHLLGVIVGVFSYQLATYSLHSTLRRSEKLWEKKDVANKENDNDE